MDRSNGVRRIGSTDAAEALEAFLILGRCGEEMGEDEDPEEMRATVENGGGGGWQGLLDSR